MAKRLARKAQLKDIESHIQQARALAAKYDVDKVNPDEYLAPSEDWSDLLNRIR